MCIFLIQVELFNTGDVIRVIDDIAKVHDLQENHGGWVDDMALVGSVPIHRNNNYSAILCFVVDSLSLIFLIFFLSCRLLARLVVWSGFSPLAMSEWWSTARHGPSTHPASSWRLGRAPLNYQVSSYNSKSLLNLKQPNS